MALEEVPSKTGVRSFAPTPFGIKRLHKVPCCTGVRSSVTVSLGISCVYGLALGYCGVYSWQRLCPGLYASPGCFRRQGGH